MKRKIISIMIMLFVASSVQAENLPVGTWIVINDELVGVVTGPGNKGLVWPRPWSCVATNYGNPLQWATGNWAGTPAWDPETKSYDYSDCGGHQANDYPAFKWVEELEFAGFTDWRLPVIHKGCGPGSVKETTGYIPGNGCDGTGVFIEGRDYVELDPGFSYYLWGSSSHGCCPSEAQGDRYPHGDVCGCSYANLQKTDFHYVRAVRDADLGIPVYNIIQNPSFETGNWSHWDHAGSGFLSQGHSQGTLSMGSYSFEPHTGTWMVVWNACDWDGEISQLFDIIPAGSEISFWWSAVIDGSPDWKIFLKVRDAATLEWKEAGYVQPYYGFKPWAKYTYQTTYPIDGIQVYGYTHDSLGCDPACMCVDDVTVIPGPPIPTELPIADAGDDIIASANEEVTLDGSGSYDPDGEIIQYTWKRLPDDVVICSGKDPNCQTRALGRVEEVIELTVTDNYLATATDTVRVISRTTQNLQDQIAALQSQIEELQQQIQELQGLVDKIASWPPIRQWLRKDQKLGDLNGDGNVNMDDFALFTKDWLR